MTIKRDLVGKTINNLEVIKFSHFSEPFFHKGKNKGRRKFWLCKCTLCGKESVQREDSLLNGHSKSCGCLQKLKATKHGQWSRDNYLYWRYDMIRQRCYNPKCKGYKDYGARGIKMCDSWLKNPKSFIDWAYSNGYKKELTIERVDVNGNYCPENCIWIPKQEQPKNRRCTVWIKYNDKLICIAEACREAGISYNACNNLRKRNKITAQRAFDFMRTHIYNRHIKAWERKNEN